MSKRIKCCAIHVVALMTMPLWTAAPVSARQDTLTLKDGSVLKGTYAGGTETTIRFGTSTGMQEVTRTNAVSLAFGPPPAPPAPPPQAPPPSAGAATPAGAIVPAGSLLMVQFTSSVSSTDAAGRRFTGVLQGDLMADHDVVIPAGAKVFGRVEESKRAGRLAGKSALALSLTEVDMGGRLVPIVTTTFSESGKGSFRKTARNAGVGALIGSAVDGGDGAGKGAAIGVGASLIKKGDSVTVPEGAVLEFRLAQSLNLGAPAPATGK